VSPGFDVPDLTPEEIQTIEALERMDRLMAAIFVLRPHVLLRRHCDECGGTHLEDLP
jgi:hypothetical protein